MAINLISSNLQQPLQQPLQQVNGNKLPEKLETINPTGTSVSSKNSTLKSITEIEKSNILDMKKAEELARSTISDDIAKFSGNGSALTQNINRKISFRVDENSGGTVISVIDKQTNETIRQIPSEELVNLSKRLRDVNEKIDSAIGILFSKDA